MCASHGHSYLTVGSWKAKNVETFTQHYILKCFKKDILSINVDGMAVKEQSHAERKRTVMTHEQTTFVT